MEEYAWEMKWIKAKQLLNKSEYELNASFKSWDDMREREEHTKKAREFTKEAIKIMIEL